MGKVRWFCKDRHLIDHASALAAFWPDAQFIHLVRDPRDVFASFRRAPGGYKQPLIFTRDWSSAQHRTTKFMAQSHVVQRSLRVSYEELLQASTEVVSRICDFLEVPFFPEMLTSGGGTQIASDNSYWMNVERPVMKDNAGRFTSTLSTRDIGIIEQEAWDVFRTLGYAPQIAQGPKRAGSLASRLARVEDAVRRRLASRVSTQSDSERLTVRRRTEFRRLLKARK